MKKRLRLAGKIAGSLLFAASLALFAANANQNQASAASKSSSDITKDLTPVPASYGYFVEHYQENQKSNNTPATNPAIAIFNNTFLQYWSPANGGTKLNPSVLDQNIQKSIQITNARTQAETVRAYLTDRRDLRYNVLSGLGPYEAAFIQNANAQTDFSVYPANPLPGNSPYSSMKWADTNSNLGNLVSLVNLDESSSWSSTGTPKAYIQYVRPYRQSSQVTVIPALKNVMAAAPANDYDFPSGHTTAAFETGLTLGYALPQRFQQLITRSSQVGYDRVLAGRHSALAVMGGRILGTAFTAGMLNDPANQSLIKQAYDQAQSKYLYKSSIKSSSDDFSSYQPNLKDYEYRLTYGFQPIGDTTKPMVVPKGAEVLLKTRQPYLSDQLRREVLYTTGLPSGYPMLDDTEGWGRLDLFKAANGFGSFLAPVKVTMNASKGGFNAFDNWRNNISGTGSLTKAGSGELELSGANTYSGGTSVDGGSILAVNNDSLGKGTVKLAGGKLAAKTGNLVVKGNYSQSKKSSLSVAANDKVTFDKKANLGGTLNVKAPKSGKKFVVLKFASSKGKFNHVKISGAKGWHISYSKHALTLVK